MYEVMKKEAAPRSGITKNTTGIPDKLKRQFETYSGLSLDGVKVHYNSGRPIQMQALAYTQADQVYIAPGQERHLGHELGHIVQQRRGQVRATGSLNGQAVNDNPLLEQEADTMASHVSGCLAHADGTEERGWHPSASGGIIQRRLEKLDFSGGQHETTDDNVDIYQMSEPVQKDIDDLNVRNFEQIQAVDEKKKIGMIFIGNVKLGDFADCDSCIVIGLKTRLGSTYYDTENEKSAPVSYSNKMAYRAYAGEKAAKELLEKMEKNGLVKVVTSHENAVKGNKGYKGLSERWYIPSGAVQSKFSEWAPENSQRVIDEWKKILNNNVQGLIHSCAEEEKKILIPQYNQLNALIGKFEFMVNAAQTAVFGNLQSSLSEAGAREGVMDILERMKLVTRGSIRTWTVADGNSLRRRILKHETFPQSHLESINIYIQNTSGEFVKQGRRPVQQMTEAGIIKEDTAHQSTGGPYYNWSVYSERELGGAYEKIAVNRSHKEWLELLGLWSSGGQEIASLWKQTDRLHLDSTGCKEIREETGSNLDEQFNERQKSLLREAGIIGSSGQSVHHWTARSVRDMGDKYKKISERQAESVVSWTDLLKAWNETQHIRITYELDNKFNTWTQGSTEWGVNSTANINASNDTPYAGWSIFKYDGTNEERNRLINFKTIRPAEIPHLHEKQDEIYKVTKGKMWLMARGDVVCVEENSQRIIKRNTPHAVVAIEPPYQHLVIQYPSLFHENGNKREVETGTMEYFYQQCVIKKTQQESGS